MNKRKLMILGMVIALLLSTLVVPCIPVGAQETQIIRVFHAGSLAVPLGALTRVSVDCSFPLIALVTKRSLEDLGLKEGNEVIVSFKAVAIHLIK